MADKGSIQNIYTCNFTNADAAAIRAENFDRFIYTYRVFCGRL